jgi:hypothetical protein
LNNGRVLGPLVARFAIVAHDRDDLVLVVGLYRDESEVVHPVGVSEVLGLLLGELVEGPEEAQIDRPLATPSEEPLQGGSVARLDKPKRDVVCAG